MDKKQAEAIADALLTPSLQQQNELKQLRKRPKTRFKIVMWSNVGLIIGSAFGFIFFGNYLPSGYIGMACGFLIGIYLKKMPWDYFL